MAVMDVINRINEMMKVRDWSDYKLAQEAGISQSTLANIRNRRSVPSIPTLEAICDAFGITLSQFFSDDKDDSQVNDEQALLLDRWNRLNEKQRSIVLDIMGELCRC